MIQNLFLLLAFQLAGEVIARAGGLLVPGPVVGLVLLLACLILSPRLAAHLQSTASGLLAHLSLLFVPAGVGVLGHLDTLAAQGIQLILALVISTLLAITVGALTFVAVARLIERGA